MTYQTAVVYTASHDRKDNAERALQYWDMHRNLALFVSSRGAYAVAAEKDAWRFQSPGWAQTSPEELEVLLLKD